MTSHKTGLRTLLFFMCLTIPLSLRAQGSSTDVAVARNSYDLGVSTGPLLPSRIGGVREILPFWSVRAAIPTTKGVFEIDGLVGKGEGTTYGSLALDYRLDIDNSYLPVHFLLGLHSDLYSPPGRDWAASGGWHYGGGITQEISGPLLFRADFKYRYGPGQSVTVGVGVVYRFGATGSSKD